MNNPKLECGTSQCANCYDCQKVGFSGGGEIYFITTEKCNLSCKYCYEKQYTNYCKTKEVFSSENVDTSLLPEKVLTLAKILNINSIGFFGGEPLVNYPIIKETVKLYKKTKRNYPNSISFGMTTNGTLLTEDIIFWLKAYGLSITLSCDGIKEAHDLNRVNAAGEGSFDKIPFELLSDIMPESVRVRMTISPSTAKYVVESFEFFKSLGFKQVIAEPVYTPDWNIEDFKKCYKDLLDNYFKDIIKTTSIHFIDSFMQNINRKTADNEFPTEGNRCGGVIAVSPNGDLTPCQQYATSEEAHNKFKFLNVFDKNFEEKLPILYKQSRIATKNIIRPKDMDCSACLNKSFCMGGCHANAAVEFGDPNLVSKEYCRLQNALYEVFIMAFYKYGGLNVNFNKNNNCNCNNNQGKR